MKKTFLICLMFVCSFVQEAAAQGIEFRKCGFEEACRMARQENKLIFIEFFTEWCGPCKIMATDVFTKPEVGTYFNKTFVCCKMDAEKEGADVASRYKVGAYPTMLFIAADGNLMNRITGASSAEDLLAQARKTVEEIDDPDNLTNLKKRYAGEKNDEKFLRKYISRMTAYHERPMEALEHYLKIQTTMKESSSKMMEFLMDYSKLLMLGGEAERIYNENIDTFMAIATTNEERELKKMYNNMLKLTQFIALDTKDADKYRLFLKGWKRLPQKPRWQDYNELSLELYLLEGDIKGFRRKAVAYLDSLTSVRTPEKVTADDDRHYQEYLKKHPLTGFYMADIQTLANKDLDAGIITRHIVTVGTKLAGYASRKDLKHFDKWIGYGKKLIPENQGMAVLEAELLMQKGKKAEAVSLLEKAHDTIKDKRTQMAVKEKLTEIEKR